MQQRELPSERDSQESALRSVAAGGRSGGTDDQYVDERE